MPKGISGSGAKIQCSITLRLEDLITIQQMVELGEVTSLSHAVQHFVVEGLARRRAEERKKK